MKPYNQKTIKKDSNPEWKGVSGFVYGKPEIWLYGKPYKKGIFCIFLC